jgi:Trypsin-like peptidase domain
MKLMRLFCVVLTIIICPFAQAQEALVRIYVTLSNGRSQGSGFFTSNDGKIITAYHVIQGANAIEVRSEKLGTFTNIRVDSISPDYDLAVLQVLNSGVTPFVNLEDYAPSNQDDLQVQGYPVGAPYQLIRTSATQPGFVQTSDYNNIRGERLFAWNVQVIPLGAIVFSGMSGGPVVYRNRVIGILSGSYVQGGSIAWAIPAKYVSTQLQPVQLKADQIERWEPVRLMDASAWKTLRSMVRMNPAAAAVSDEVSNGVEALAETYSELYKQAMQTQQDMKAYQPILERVATASSLEIDAKTSNELMEQASGLLESIEKFENLSDQAGKQGQEMAQEMIKLGMWIADQSHVDERTGKALAKRMTSVTDEHKDMTQGIDAYVGVDSQAVAQVGRKFTVTTIKSRTLAGEARAFLQFLDTWSAIVNAYSSPRALLFMSADISMKRRIVQLLEPVVYQMN